MRPHVEAQFGRWDVEEQVERFSSGPKPADHEIIEISGNPVGCILLREYEDHFQLARLYLLPEFHRQGIGSRILTELCERADLEDMPIELQALKVNRARGLYERFGFFVYDETDSHIKMKRVANA